MAKKLAAVAGMKRAALVAAGKVKADVVLKNASYLDVFSAELRTGDIAICGRQIAGIGDYDGETEYDFTGKVVTPGLIDAHVHIESTQLSPEEFASLAVPRGTTLVIADPHEIVNVCSLEGAEYIRRAAGRTPLEVKLMLPSCVPATPFETSGANLNSVDTARALTGTRFFGLGEMMNYPAVAAGDEEVLAKLLAAKHADKIIDGHAPTMSGKALNAYCVSGARTDHECATAAEAEEKVMRGMYVLLREGSASHDLANLVPAVNDKNFRRFALCTDDRHADDLAREGHMDHVLRTAVKAGIRGELAVVMCTLNAAECYGIKEKGAVAPGYDADLAVFDDLEHFNCAAVFKRGKCVAENGKKLFSDRGSVPVAVKNTVRVAPVTPDKFTIKLKGSRARVIGLRHNTLVTQKLVEEVESRDGDVCLEGSDLLRLAVVERHFASGRMGLGLVKGYGLKGGAAATTVSHDSHNIIVIGDNKEDMAAAVEELKNIGGGMTLVRGGKAQSVPLDIAGLMSSAPAAKHVELSAKLYEAAREAGVYEGIEPFMTLSFLALAVIPELRLTDRGLFDVNDFCITSLDAE